MKRFVFPKPALTLGLLLALCACTPGGQTNYSADSSEHAKTTETAETAGTAAAAPTESPDAAGALHMVWAGSDTPSASHGQLYETASTYLYDSRCLTAVDLQTGVQRMLCTKNGCPHNSPDCDAWICEAGLSLAQCGAFAEDGRLYRVYATDPHHGMGGELRSCVEVSSLDGSGRTLLCEDFVPDGSCIDITWLADDTALYACIQSNPGVNEKGDTKNRFTVQRIPKTPGSPAELLYQWQSNRTGNMAESLQVAGVSGGQLLVTLTELPTEHTGSLAGDYAASTTTLHVLDLNTRTLGDSLDSWTVGSGQGLSLRQVYGGLLWTIDGEGTLTAADPLTGDTAEHCPGIWPEEMEPRGIFGLYGRRLVVDGYDRANDLEHRYVFDLDTGTMQRELSVTWYKEATKPRLPALMADDGEHLMLKVEERPVTRTTVGQDGAVVQYPSSDSVFAVIPAEDYLDGSEDWTTCTLLPAEEN